MQPVLPTATRFCKEAPTGGLGRDAIRSAGFIQTACRCNLRPCHPVHYEVFPRGGCRRCCSLRDNFMTRSWKFSPGHSLSHKMFPYSNHADHRSLSCLHCFAKVISNTGICVLNLVTPIVLRDIVNECRFARIPCDTQHAYCRQRWIGKLLRGDYVMECPTEVGPQNFWHPLASLLHSTV